MENNFELKKIRENAQVDNAIEKSYTLEFESNDETKTINLSGLGKIRETVKI